MKTMTLALAREWTHPQSLLAGSQGNMQTLPNGDRFVGWGAQPNLTEFSPRPARPVRRRARRPRRLLPCLPLRLERHR
jgi:hypothetical protein